ncbi:unnamed protein product, partial [Vitis vinifera]
MNFGQKIGKLPQFMRRKCEMGFGLWRGLLRESGGEVEGEGGSCGCTSHLSKDTEKGKSKGL